MEVTQFLLLRTIDYVACLLAVILYQRNPYRENEFGCTVSTMRFILQSLYLSSQNALYKFMLYTVTELIKH